MKAVQIRITGKVQNVGFRNFAKRKADEHKIKGYVKNAPDGSIEILAEGDDFRLEKFIRECRRGPLLAAIKEVKINYLKNKTQNNITNNIKKDIKQEESEDSEECEGFEGFEIKL